jgi:hypothetical protein
LEGVLVIGQSAPGGTNSDGEAGDRADRTTQGRRVSSILAAGDDSASRTVGIRPQPPIYAGRPLSTYFHHLAHDPTLKAKAILVKADQVADEVGLDEEVGDGLVVGFGME